MDVFDHVLVCSVVDEDVDGAHLLQSGVDNLSAILLLLEVDLDEMAFGTVLLDLLLSLLSVLLLDLKVGNQAVGSFHGEHDGDGTANSRVSTGDDCLLAFELASSLVELVASIFGREVLILGGWALAIVSVDGTMAVLVLKIITLHVLLDSRGLLMIDWDRES